MARMNERAQSLLIGAVFMAVIFVSLALLLNSSLYGTTLATSASDDVTGGESQVLRDAVRDDVSALIDDAIASHGGSYGDQKSYVQENVTALDDQYSGYYAQYDRIVDLDTDSFTRGSKLTPTGSHLDGDLNDDGTTDDREPLPSDLRYRQFLIEPNSFESDAQTFTVEIDDGSSTWEIRIDGSATNMDVVVDNGATTETCSVSGPEPVDIVNASVGTERCDALDFEEQTDPPYDITFHNGDQIEGDYELIVNDTSTVGSDVDREAILYSATVDLWERTPETRYSAEIRVAPGEPR